jgi:hypothetical protein
MSDNITIRLTPEEKAELERLDVAHREASIASRRELCAVASTKFWALERAFWELSMFRDYIQN